MAWFRPIRSAPFAMKMCYAQSNLAIEILMVRLMARVRSDEVKAM